MQLITTVNFAIWVIFFVCYLYQMYYILVPYIKKEKPLAVPKENRFAVLISARNEENVIRQLLESIANQTYPSELVDVYVVADNCTDATAEIAKQCGANVYERFDKIKVGKGYALNYLLKEISRSRGSEYYDGYFVFDADNVLDPHYIEEMNKTFSSGYEILTSYRNSKNYGDNWISAGYGLWFLRESKYLNYSRMLLDTSCAISGTGFMFSKDIAKELNGWKYYLLTEDIEFTVDHVINNYKIGFCKNAVLYDEQPKEFGQSVRQRMRWAKGYFQVLCNYGSKLIKGIFKDKSFSCYDMSMSIMPALILTIFSAIINMTAILVGLVADISVQPIIHSLMGGFLSMYTMMYVIGAITTITERKMIYTSTFKKILYTFTFPLFMMTYIPITFMALFKKVEWKPIVHSQSKTLADIKSIN
jgi:cellulose synthase/poly-beta-1,6-N-acetylglucosamine synthase-like glycosyltransferase